MPVLNSKELVSYLERIRSRTRGVIDCIPPAQIEWRPTEGRFSFGDLVRHIAVIERHMYAETAAGRPSCYSGESKSLADGYDNVLAFMDRLHVESIAIFSSLSDEDLINKCLTPAGIEITVWKWLRAMVEHEVHHRGQIYLMLGILGVPAPPLFGLTSEKARTYNL